eukprot:TRINITY_DN3877_c0_g1_i1.p1 TRINITY_DN3877_c0_g1~~TRINITY_DN3877_c0_g1_i1.p1  ORF type:complete len:113 (+),score=25.57 TRINITY_DN3877_c0_g1_i1:81-419(+)
MCKTEVDPQIEAAVQTLKELGFTKEWKIRWYLKQAGGNVDVVRDLMVAQRNFKEMKQQTKLARKQLWRDQYYSSRKTIQKESSLPTQPTTKSVEVHKPILPSYSELFPSPSQ